MPFFLFLYHNDYLGVHPYNIQVEQLPVITAEYVLSDLTNNGTSEFAIVRNYQGYEAISIQDLNFNYLEVIRLEGELLSDRIIHGDLDGDGYDELYFFSVFRDSIYLHGEEPFDSVSCINFQVYLDETKKVNDRYGISLLNMDPVDQNGDGFEDLVFALKAGYTLQPRRVYVYDLKHKELKKSPLSGASILKIDAYDIDHDNKLEIFIRNSATQNYPDTSDMPFNDNTAHITVLDDDLSYLFPPIKIAGNKPYSISFPVKHQNKSLIAAISGDAKDLSTNEYSILDVHGKVYEGPALIGIVNPIKFLSYVFDNQEKVFLSDVNTELKIFMIPVNYSDIWK